MINPQIHGLNEYGENFGHHWRELAQGFVDGCDTVDGMLLRYEDLCSGSVDVPALEAYLQAEIDTELLTKKVGTHRHEGDGVPAAELKQLQNEVSVLAELLGYKTL